MQIEPPIKLGFIAHNNDETDMKWGRDHGLHWLEYNYHLDFDHTFPEAANLSLMLRRNAVHASAVGCWGQEFISLDAKKRELARERLIATIGFAASLGCKVVMTGGGDREGDDLKSKLRDVVEAYRGIPEAALEKGVRLAFYNCHWANCVTGPAAWDVVLKELPGVGIKFDPSHPYHAGEDPYGHLADYAQHVIHFHAKEVLTAGGRVIDEPMAGQGDFHWGKLIGILYKAGYRGVISIEPHSETWSGHMRRPGILLAKRELERFIAPMEA
jgi:sugar phosphate isomerase/epimerase